MLALLLGPISIVGLLWFLIYCAIVVCVILGLQWLAAKVGWAVPQPLWAVVGFIVFLLLVILFIQGALGPPTFR